MNEEMKKFLLAKAENHMIVALDEVIELADMYAKSTEDNAIDDAVVQAVKLLKGLVVDAIDKIDGEDNK